MITVINKNRCEHCGANLKAFWHTLTPGLAAILIKCFKFVRENNKNEFHLQKDLHLNVNEFSNFTKLRFHALVAKIDDKPGYWLVTKRGGEFLRGEISIPPKVKTFRNRVEGHSTETVTIAEVRAADR